MKFWAYSKEAWTSLLATKQRTFLSLFGIIIAIASVIGLVSTGQMITAEALAKFKTMGVDQLVIQMYSFGDEEEIPLKPLDIFLNLENDLSCVKQVSPFVRTRLKYYPDDKVESITTLGVRQNYVPLSKLEVAEGRFISDLDAQQRFIVLGAKVPEKLRLIGHPASFIGREVVLNSKAYTIIGILDSQPLGDFIEFDKTMFVPIKHAFKLKSNDSIDYVLAQMEADVDAEECAIDVENYLLRRNPPPYIDIYTADDLLEQMHEQTELLNTLLIAIVSISLLVGGAGIMNVMLISVSERRQEIGIRAALGAKRHDIRMQFLIEAMMLTLAGGVIGTFLGVAITYGVAWYKEWTFAIDLNVLLAGIGVSLAAGILFGFFPAHRAANLNPIEALRSD